MARLADLILAAVPYRLPTHLYSYVPGVSPMSTDKSVAIALVSYLATIFGIQAIQRNRQPAKLTTLFQAHNVFLSSGSALLLVLMLEEIIPIWYQRGLHGALCDAEAWTPVWICIPASCILVLIIPAAHGVLLHDQLLLQVH